MKVSTSTTSKRINVKIYLEENTKKISSTVYYSNEDDILIFEVRLLPSSAGTQKTTTDMCPAEILKNYKKYFSNPKIVSR